MELRENILYLWLSLSGLKPINQQKCLEKFSVGELFERVGRDSSLYNILGESVTESLKTAKNEKFIEKTLDIMDKAGIEYITITDVKYPARLNQPEVAPSCVLYYKGDFSILSRTSVSVVGTRRPTLYGKEVTQKFVSELSGYGIAVVSGLATGIDGYAHRASLDSGGKTVAVMASGLTLPTPRSHSALFREVAENGLLLSEYPPEQDAARYTFPERNRIISALSPLTIVVEAAERSGSLITADCATEQNREVFAVPGSIFAPKSAGTNMLIKNGARPLTSVKDVLSFLNLQHSDGASNLKTVQLDMYEQGVYNMFKGETRSFDYLSENTRLTYKELINVLFSLEMKGMVRKLPGNMYKEESEV